MKYFRSLHFRFLSLLLLVSVIATIFRVGYVLPNVQDALTEASASQQWSLAAYIADDIDQEVRARRTTLSEVAASLPPALLKDARALGAWVAERQQLARVFDAQLEVFRPDGTSIARAGKLDFRYAGDADWFDAALKADAPVLGRPIPGIGGREVLLPMALTVRDSARRPLAVVAGFTRLGAPDFLGRLQQTVNGESGSLTVVSPADKLTLSASNPSLIMQPTPPAGINALHDRAMAGFRGHGSTQEADGRTTIAGIVGVPSAGWFVVASIPADEALRPVTILRGLMMRATVIGYIIIFTLVLVALPRILSTLRRTAAAMRDMADGRRELAPLPIERDDEVGSLVAGFNHLVERLREKETALKASEASMQYLAHHDPLTGLVNRTVLNDRLDQALARAERNKGRFALLFFDLDGFKEINDEHGHHVGDGLLRQVATRLAEGRRRTDTVARLGGDEFVVLLADLDEAVSPRSAALDVAEQCVAVLASPYVVENRQLRLSASVGVAVYEGRPVSGSQLLSQADIAMYQAKRAGKNRAYAFTPDLVDNASRS